MVPHILAVICAGLLAGVAPESLKEYQEKSAGVGRDAEGQVRLALWCEQHGLLAERSKHLALAVLYDPKNATARGLLGMVAVGSRWERPDALAAKAAEDDARAKVLAEYNGRRERAADTADDQWALALWCERNGLKPEAVAHLTAVTRLDPSRSEAWLKLGCRKHHGRWMRPEEIAAELAEAEAQGKADRHWQPLLERWALALKVVASRQEAEERLARVTDPRAVPSVCRAFARGDENKQALTVRLLGQIDAPAAARAVALLAVGGRTESVRRLAIAALGKDDPRDFVGDLIDMLRAPLRYEVKPVRGPGSTGVLFVEGERFNLRRLYAPPAVPKVEFKKGDVLEFDPFGLPVIARVHKIKEVPVPGTRLRALVPEGEMIPICAMMTEATRSAQGAQKQLQEDVAWVKRYNERARDVNGRAGEVLLAVTGARFPTDEPETWRVWWTDQQGYTTATAQGTYKPTIVQNVPLRYRPQSGPVAFQGRAVGYRLGHSCFAAGTPVRTLTGPRPIEDVRVGDQVLTQDTTTGALGFEPVVAVHHNPPNRTVRVAFEDGGAVVATGIHRFWKAGKGWVMARDLKPGDALRTLGGLCRVVEASADREQPVFNLEVAKHQDFFVGTRGVLVHDNSLVQPTPAPFDADSTLVVIEGP